jgi:recombination protein RecA
MAVKEVNSEKLKALQLTMEKLDKAYGKGSVMKLGDSPVEKVEVIPTGSIRFSIGNQWVS